jgi:hypothetical protein
MGTYGDLMKLNETTKVLKSKHPDTAIKSTFPSNPPSRDSSIVEAASPDTVIPRHHDTVKPTKIPRHHDMMVASIRHAVKGIGKEAATHRFTLEEKKAIADIVFTYKMNGTKTSENEVARIAINFIVADYKDNGKNSVLEKVLQALND